jgi:hypothetical protein
MLKFGSVVKKFDRRNAKLEFRFVICSRNEWTFQFTDAMPSLVTRCHSREMLYQIHGWNQRSHFPTS